MLNDPMTDGIYSVAQDVSDNAKCMEPRHAITIALQWAMTALVFKTASIEMR